MASSPGDTYFILRMRMRLHRHGYLSFTPSTPRPHVPRLSTLNTLNTLKIRIHGGARMEIVRVPEALIRVPLRRRVLRKIAKRACVHRVRWVCGMRNMRAMGGRNDYVTAPTRDRRGDMLLVCRRWEVGIHLAEGRGNNDATRGRVDVARSVSVPLWIHSRCSMGLAWVKVAKNSSPPLPHYSISFIDDCGATDTTPLV